MGGHASHTPQVHRGLEAEEGSEPGVAHYETSREAEVDGHACPFLLVVAMASEHRR